MSLQAKGFSAGKLSGIVCDFPEPGDVLPMHSHGPEDVHITIVARGRVRAHGPHIGSTDYAAGAVIDWPVGIQHEIIGIEAGSRIVNIIKGGSTGPIEAVKV